VTCSQARTTHSPDTFPLAGTQVERLYFTVAQTVQGQFVCRGQVINMAVPYGNVVVLASDPDSIVSECEKALAETG
jgi:hypothetical protein